MKIYSITQDIDNTSDTYGGHVVIANTRSEVVLLAKSVARDEGPSAWFDVNVTEEGNYTGIENEPFILLSDFRAG